MWGNSGILNFGNEILNDLLSLGKIEEGKILLNNTEFSLTTFFEDLKDADIKHIPLFSNDNLPKKYQILKSPTEE